MKTRKALSLFAMMIFSYVAQAHDYNGDLGQDKTATDFHVVSCSDGTSQIYFSMTVFDASSSDTLVSAKVLGDSSTFSVTAAGGNIKITQGIDVPTTSGALILVSKNKSGSVNYNLAYHCQSASGEHTETDLSTLQNQ